LPAEFTPEIWEGDGLPEDDEEALDLFALLFAYEIEAIIEATKREAWVREKVAKYEDRPESLLMAQFFWRRVEHLRHLAKLDEELTQQYRDEQ
jgi:hypothetical protein